MKSAVLWVLVAAMTWAWPTARAVEVQTAQGSYSLHLTSLKDARFRHTIRQKYDFSCGSAALATLLTHHYNFPVSEQDVFSEMFVRGDQAKIKKEGFSLLDIKNYLANHGFDADGYVAEVDKQFAQKEVELMAI